MSGPLHPGAIHAVWRRQLGSLLGNPLGYVFILTFVAVAGAFLFLPDDYFARNIADLGPLVDLMPWLLVVLLPALSMGSWATERELGTEEQLLTLPLTDLDALLGKWLGIVSFFTLALGCSLSNVIVLLWIGEPDLGLVLGNYLGWWVLGVTFAALALLASTLVSMPAIAFVLGTLFCAGTMFVADTVEWTDSFDRGVAALGAMGMAGAVAAVALGLATFLLGSRRWRPSDRSREVVQSVTFVALTITLINLAVIVDRAAVDVDVTSEGLSSLSPTSLAVLDSLDRPVKIVAFISQDLPPELARKGKEVENKLKVLDRELGDKVKLEIHRPGDPLDPEGSLATEHYGLQPRMMSTETVAGRERVEVFLGAAVTSGSRTQKIDHFDPGLSVEYELVRSIRAVGGQTKKVLGVVKTDLQVMGDFDFRTRQMKPEWQIVREWRKQYEVREVNLDAPVGEDVDVLFVAQVSRLGEEQLVHLHDALWNGVPTLILEDPMPVFAGHEFGSSQPKSSSQPSPFGGPPQGGPDERGDLRPLLTALGIDYDDRDVAWSGFTPSQRYEWPRNYVWVFRDHGAMTDAPATTGIDSLLTLWPGFVAASPGKPGELTVTPLVSPISEAGWGRHDYDEHFARNFFGQQTLQEPAHFEPEVGPPPALAVEITGRMRRAYAFDPLDPTAPIDESGDGDSAEGVGALSGKPAHVIFVADTDLAHDEFFRLYRNPDGALDEDALNFLRELRNVQFLANAVDALADDADFLELRTRRPRRRPLTVLENVMLKTEKALGEAEDEAQRKAQDKIDELQGDFQERLARVDDVAELDENAKDQLRAQIRDSAQRQLDVDTARINREAQVEVRKARIEQRREISMERTRVRWLAMGVPAGLLAMLALFVFAHRRRGERLHVPAARQRSAS